MTFKEIVAKYEHLESPKAIGAAIFAEHGVEVFSMFGNEYLIALLSEQARQHVSRDRTRSIRTTKEFVSSTQVRCRVGLAGDYWAKRWLVNGTYVETRDLSLDNIEWLINQRQEIVDRTQAQIEFLQANLSLAKQHNAQTLGELERNDIQLVEVHKLQEAA